jgi:vacuolar protein sorting-associated protein 3
VDPDAVVFNLVRNYSPHLKPDTGSAPPTAELRKILQERALEMLEKFLKKERRRRMALDLDKEEPESTASSKGKEKERPRPIRMVRALLYGNLCLANTLQIIDTVLAKIYAQSEKTTDLYDLLFSSNYVLLSEVEEVFRTTGQYNALCMMYQRGGAEYDEKLLDVWSK